MTRVHLRWMIRRDLPEVLAIEREAFEFPWDEDDFAQSLGNRNVIGMVAEAGDDVVGYMVYELEARSLFVRNLCVAAQWRRRGVGRQLAEKLLARLTAAKRSRIHLLVRERNLAAQLFWRAIGFRATYVLRGVYDYDDTDEDAYRFEFRVGWPAPDLARSRAGLDEEGRRGPALRNLRNRFFTEDSDAGFE